LFIFSIERDEPSFLFRNPKASEILPGGFHLRKFVHRCFVAGTDADM